MSGIVGIWNLDGKPVEDELLARLSIRLAHRGPDGEGRWVNGPVGLSCHLFRVTPEAATEIQPLIHPSGSVVVFDGRLDNRTELLEAIKPHPEITLDSPDPDLVAAAHASFGDSFPERLNGDFALAIFDPDRQQLILARDAIGVRPLYYCRTGNTFIFASEIKAILAHPHVSARPDDDMLAAFLAGNRAQNCHGMTFFAGISSLIPGCLAIVNHKGATTRRYWDFDPERQTRFGSFEEYAEEFRSLFEQAVSRRLRSANTVAVSVSGGLDSSSIYCVGETLRRRASGRFPSLLGVSYTSADGTPSDEKSYLAEIERQYGTNIERLPMSGPGFMNGCLEEVWHVESPFLDLQWNSTVGLMRFLHQRGTRVLLTGQWGDQMMVDQSYLIDRFRHLAWNDVLTHLREYPRWMTDADPRYFRRLFFRQLISNYLPAGLIPPLQRLKAKFTKGVVEKTWYVEGFQKQARKHMHNRNSVNGHSATAHFKSLYREARSRYHVLGMEWNNKVASMYGMETVSPFLDRDLLSFLMGVPGEMQTWKGIPKALLREAMKGILPAPIAARRWKARFTNLVNEGMDLEYPQLLYYLENGSLAAQFGYVNRSIMNKELMRLRNRVRRHNNSLISWSLRDLLGLELWLKTFFGSKLNEREVTELCKQKLSPGAL